MGPPPAAASGGHSSPRRAGLPPPRPLLSRSTGSRRAGSATVAHGPSCSVACGILPDQGSNPCPLHRQADSQPLRHQGSPSQVSVDGHLGSFHVLAIVNSAAMNIGVHIAFQIRVFMFSSCIPSSGNAGSYDSSISSFLKEIPYCFPVIAPIYIPTNSIGGFSFSTPSPACHL